MVIAAALALPGYPIGEPWQGEADHAASRRVENGMAIDEPIAHRSGRRWHATELRGDLGCT
jgi:hypothetical protein